MPEFNGRAELKRMPELRELRHMVSKDRFGRDGHATGESGRAEVRGCRLARSAVCYNLEIDLLAFLKTAEPRLFDGADVNEHVLPAFIRLDEAVALLRVKPFNSASRH